MLARGDAEGEVAEDRVVRAVGEADLLKNHLAGTGPLAAAADGGGRAVTGGQICDFDRLLEQLADALNGGEAALDLGEAFSQLAQGIEQPLGIEDEGGEGAEPHGAAEHHPAA